MYTIAIDTETWLIQPGILAPPLVCVTWARKAKSGIEEGILDRHDGVVFFREQLEAACRGDAILVFQNAPYDLAVAVAMDYDLLPLVFQAYEVGGIRDIKERQKLIDLAAAEMRFTRDPETGEFLRQYYSLEHLALRHLDIQLAKNVKECTTPGCRATCACGSWRLHFDELTDVPLADWPEDAVDYAMSDAAVTLQIYDIQCAHTSSAVVDEQGNVTNELDQYRAGWAFQLMSLYGIRTDGEAVEKLKAVLLEHRAAMYEKLRVGFKRCTNTDLTCSRFPNLLSATECAKCKRDVFEAPVYHEIGKCLDCGFQNDIEAKKCAQCTPPKRRRKKGEEPPPPHTDCAEHPELAAACEVCSAPGSRLKTGILRWYTPKRGVSAGVTKISKNTAEIGRRISVACAAAGRDVLRTPTGEISITKEILETSGDPLLRVLAEGMQDEKLLTTYVPVLETGTQVPINARYNTLVETGRASCSSPNLMNLPRRGNVRECYVPRPGWLFCSTDYSQLELCTLAQILINLFGYSSFADDINEGKDLHLDLAAQILGISYAEAERRKHEKEVKDARQLSKVGNFGLGGGMGAPKLVDFAKATYGLELRLDPDPTNPDGRSARELKETWLKRRPEMRRYFDYMSKLVGESGEGTVVQHVSNRVRGGTPYCAACNSGFQGLAADGAKAALWAVTKECWLDETSALFGCRPVVFVHDEIIIEVPDDEHAHEASQRLTDVMIHAMVRYVPDVKISATPTLMRRWYKNADAVYDTQGRLVPWEPPQEKTKQAVAA